MLFIVPMDVRDSRDPARERRVFFDDGDNETFAIGTKTPNLGLHSKYLREIKSEQCNRAVSVKIHTSGRK